MTHIDVEFAEKKGHKDALAQEVAGLADELADAGFSSVMTDGDTGQKLGVFGPIPPEARAQMQGAGAHFLGQSMSQKRWDTIFGPKDSGADKPVLM